LGTRRNYLEWVRLFLQNVFGGNEKIAVGKISVHHVTEFVSATTRRYKSGSVELAATSLRSFFRFLRATGLRADRMEDAVPMVPHRRSDLVRHLDRGSFERLMAELGSSSPRGLRDRAIILCAARLGMRSSEITRMRLDDISWLQASVRVPTRKTGHGALLPLTPEVGTALAEYLQHGRPGTDARQVFVLHRQRVGAPISESIVGRAVGHALRQAGIEASTSGANLLRHSLATDLLGRGASLVEIADLMGHRSLATTRIYASVDMAALREVALPWPKASS